MIPDRNLFGIDPGGTTGLCIWHREKRAYTVWQIETPVSGPPWLGVEEFRLKFRYLVNRFRPVTVLLEKFEFRHEERHRDKIDYTAAELNGVAKDLYLEHYLDRLDVELVIQQASQAKQFWDDDKLRRLGLWRGTESRHAMDALRHVLYYRTFVLNDKSVLEQLK